MSLRPVESPVANNQNQWNTQLDCDMKCAINRALQYSCVVKHVWRKAMEILANIFASVCCIYWVNFTQKKHFIKSMAKPTNAQLFIVCILSITYCSSYRLGIVAIFTDVTKVSLKVVKVKQSHYRPWQALRLPDFKTIGTWRWQGCQPYAPTAFTPRKYSWYPFLLEAESTPGP
jgi:hypothetical protein